MSDIRDIIGQLKKIKSHGGPYILVTRTRIGSSDTAFWFELR